MYQALYEVLGIQRGEKGKNLCYDGVATTADILELRQQTNYKVNNIVH